MKILLVFLTIFLSISVSQAANWSGSTYNPSAVAITGGTIGGLTNLTVNSGSLFLDGTSTLATHNAALQFNASVNSVGYFSGNQFLLSGVPLMSATAPTIASGFGTTPTIVNSNGTAAFSVNVGTGGTASSGILTFPAATTNWNCAVVNQLSGAGTLTQQSAHTSTSVTLTNYTIATDVAVAWTASYVIELNCVAK